MAARRGAAYDVDALRQRMIELRDLLGLEPSPRRFWRGEGPPSGSPAFVRAGSHTTIASDAPRGRWGSSPPNSPLPPPADAEDFAAAVAQRLSSKNSAATEPFAVIKAVSRTSEQAKGWNEVDFVRPPGASASQQREQDKLLEVNDHLRALLAAERRELAVLRGEPPPASATARYGAPQRKARVQDGWYVPVWFTVDLGGGARVAYLLEGAPGTTRNAAHANTTAFAKALGKEIACGLQWDVGLSVRCVALSPQGPSDVEAEVQFLFKNADAAAAFGSWVQSVVKNAPRRFPDGWKLPKSSECFARLTDTHAACEVDIAETTVGAAAPLDSGTRAGLRSGPREVPEILAKVDADFVGFDAERFVAALGEHLRQGPADRLDVAVPWFYVIDAYELKQTRGAAMTYVHFGVSGTDLDEEWAALVSELGESGRLFRSLRVLSAEALASKEAHKLRASSPSRCLDRAAEAPPPAATRLSDRVLLDRKRGAKARADTAEEPRPPTHSHGTTTPPRALLDPVIALHNEASSQTAPQEPSLSPPPSPKTKYASTAAPPSPRLPSVKSPSGSGASRTSAPPSVKSPTAKPPSVKSPSPGPPSVKSPIYSSNAPPSVKSPVKSPTAAGSRPGSYLRSGSVAKGPPVSLRRPTSPFASKGAPGSSRSKGPPPTASKGAPSASSPGWWSAANVPGGDRPRRVSPGPRVRVLGAGQKSPIPRPVSPGRASPHAAW
eukprot:TRINITY_DN25019_c0_g1_i1.p1 TRINITY_DN25019_c0_g1~~TRINITY_DN25019_c0_g1_i1.p1  ORF type:complete len:723 (+),score=139.77 TRINITY_DN25019_c0_g1_i1:58-2226(+)